MQDDFILEMRDIVKEFPGVRALTVCLSECGRARSTPSAERTAQANQPR